MSQEELEQESEQLMTEEQTSDKLSHIHEWLGRVQDMCKSLTPYRENLSHTSSIVGFMLEDDELSHLLPDFWVCLKT